MGHNIFEGSQRGGEPFGIFYLKMCIDITANHKLVGGEGIFHVFEWVTKSYYAFESEGEGGCEHFYHLSLSLSITLSSN